MENYSTYVTGNGASINACAVSPCGNFMAFNFDQTTLKIVSLVAIRYEPLNNNVVNLNDTLPCLFENKFSSQIRCLCFGQGDVDRNRLPHRSNKRRITYHDIHNACLLAVGLKSGEIKVYSLVPNIIFGSSQPLIENGGNTKLILHDHFEDLATISFSHDGSLRLASASIDGKMRLWDMWDDGNMYHLIKIVNFKPFCCSWGNRSRHICIVGSMGKGFVYQSEKPCVQIANLNSGHFNNISACRYSSDDSLLATCSFDTSVALWCAATYKPLLQIWQTGSKPSLIYMGGQHQFNIRDLEISTDCLHLISVTDDTFIRLWNLEETENPVDQLAIPFDGRKLILNCVRSFPGGRKYVVGTNDGRLLFFDGLHEPATLATLCRKSIRTRLIYKLHTYISPEIQYKSDAITDKLEVQPMSMLEMHCSMADIRRRSTSHVLDSKRFKKTVTLDSLIEELPIPRMLKSYLLYGLHGANVLQNSEPRPLNGHFRGRNMSVF